VIDVCDGTSPSMCAVVPMSTTPTTCQNTFWASAPPVRMTFVAAPRSVSAGETALV
jgi:hypothetical protein